jgi:predicted secreted acid phosphatase
MLNPDLTQENALWLVEKYVPRMGGIINGKTMDEYFVPARTMLMGKKVDRPGCGCHFKSYVMMTNSLYNQHEAEIRNIAYPPKTKTRAKRKTI